VISALARVEVVAALWRKHRIGELDLDDALILIRAFQLDCSGTPRTPPRFITLAVLDPFIERAAELAGTHGLRAYDAIQLASALAAREADERCDTIASFDQLLTRAAIAEGFDAMPAATATPSSPARLPRVRRFDLGDGRQLRPVEEGDAGELHALIERNREQLARWIQWAEKQTPAQTIEFIQRARAKAAQRTGLDCAILAEGRIVGVVGFPTIDSTNQSATIGYWLDAAQQGRGIMTSAVDTLIDHAFSAWQLNRLEIRIDVKNRRSRAVAERLGFTYEGTLRQAYRVGDRYSDDAVYSLLASDRT
jgi:ribosomal-protein-serine acetyltransferase